MTIRKAVWIPVALAAFLAVYFIYLGVAFTGNRCEGAAVKHGAVADGQDCLTCHKKVTPKIAQDWYESKHGVILVKCYVCHGQPDGKGAVPFEAKPSVSVVCQRCHAPAIDKMREKYGVREACESCHLRHANSLHHEAYERADSKQKFE
jgi:hypothetical protein